MNFAIPIYYPRILKLRTITPNHTHPQAKIVDTAGRGREDLGHGGVIAREGQGQDFMNG